MQILPDFYAQYYSIFCKKAEKIINVTRSFSFLDKKEIAHDIVIDFFLSSSLQYIYQPEKGDIEKFFASYVRKRIWSITRKLNRWRYYSNIDTLMWRLSSPVGLYSSELFIDSLAAICFLLKNKFWFSRKAVFSLDIVFKHVIILVLEQGRVTMKDLSNRLQLSHKQTKDVFKCLKNNLEIDYVKKCLFG